jgi:hypothetical protein
VRKFFAVVVGVVALGLTLRYALNRPEPAKPKAPVALVTQPHAGTATTPPTEPPTPSERTPAPPRIPGSTMITDAAISHYAVAPGVLYYCDETSLMMQPKAGGDPTRVGDCAASSDLVADANGVFYCSDDKLMRVTAGTTGSHVVAEDTCIMMALDERYAYYARPGFDGMEGAGVYRVERSGGTPERIHERNKEQFGVHVAADGVYITGYFLGTVTKLSGGKKTTLISGQKNLEDFATDATYMYWAPEFTGELRRRKKTGGPIEVIAKNVMSYPFEVVDGHVYWIDKADGAFRVMHLAPGVQEADVIASGLGLPSLEADAEGVYVTELDRPGVFWFKR